MLTRNKDSKKEDRCGCEVSTVEGWDALLATDSQFARMYKLAKEQNIDFQVINTLPEQAWEKYFLFYNHDFYRLLGYQQDWTTLEFLYRGGVIKDWHARYAMIAAFSGAILNQCSKEILEEKIDYFSHLLSLFCSGGPPDRIVFIIIHNLSEWIIEDQSHFMSVVDYFLNSSQLTFDRNYYFEMVLDSLVSKGDYSLFQPYLRRNEACNLFDLFRQLFYKNDISFLNLLVKEYPRQDIPFLLDKYTKLEASREIGWVYNGYVSNFFLRIYENSDAYASKLPVDLPFHCFKLCETLTLVENEALRQFLIQKFVTEGVITQAKAEELLIHMHNCTTLMTASQLTFLQASTWLSMQENERHWFLVYPYIQTDPFLSLELLEHITSFVLGIANEEVRKLQTEVSLQGIGFFQPSCQQNLPSENVLGDEESRLFLIGANNG